MESILKGAVLKSWFSQVFVLLILGEKPLFLPLIDVGTYYISELVDR